MTRRTVSSSLAFLLNYKKGNLATYPPDRTFYVLESLIYLSGVPAGYVRERFPFHLIEVPPTRTASQGATIDKVKLRIS